MERDRHDRQSRRPRQQGGLGQGRRARALAGDEADRPLGRRADEHPSHQLDLGLDQGDGAGGHQGAAEDLGRIQRRLRQGGRREAHLPRPFQPGLDRRDDVRSGRLRPEHRSLPQGLRRRRHQGDALARNGQGVRADAPDGVEIHGSGDRRPRLRHRDQHDRQGPGRLHDHGRLADRHFHRRRTEGRRRTTNARRRRPTGASRASSSTRTRSSSSSRRIPTTSRGRSCSRISSCRRNSRPCSIRPRARFRRGSTSICRRVQPLPAAVAEGLAGLDRRRHAGALDGAQHDHPAEVSRRDHGHHHLLREQPENDRRRKPRTRWRTPSKRRSKQHGVRSRGA